MQFGIQTWYVATYNDGGKTVPLDARTAFTVMDILGPCSGFAKVEQHTGLRLGRKRLSLAHHRIK